MIVARVSCEPLRLDKQSGARRPSTPGVCRPLSQFHVRARAQSCLDPLLHPRLLPESRIHRFSSRHLRAIAHIKKKGSMKLLIELPKFAVTRKYRKMEMYFIC